MQNKVEGSKKSFVINGTTLVKVHNDDIQDGHFTCLEGIEIIGYRAFYGCTNLTSINLPQGLTAIGSGAFYRCTKLTSITLAQGLTAIEDYAFYGCTNLTSINLPQGLSTIGGGAFSGCTKLTSITMPQGLTAIGDEAFYRCTNLTSITPAQGLTTIGRSAFLGCTNLTSITLAQGLTAIEDYAFSGCTKLTSITLPQGLTAIGDEAFYGCTNLKHIIIESEDESEINRIRSLLSKDLQDKVVKKSSCIHWLFTINEAFSDNEVPQDVSTVITDLVFSSGNRFFKKGNVSEQLQVSGLIVKEKEHTESSNHQNNTF